MKGISTNFNLFHGHFMFRMHKIKVLSAKAFLSIPVFSEQAKLPAHRVYQIPCAD